jgi:hypothetical protein
MDCGNLLREAILSKEATTMALFMIERSFAAALNPSPKDIKTIGEVNSKLGVTWLHSFLSADKRKTYCLYEAENSESIREAARRAGLPIDAIVELSGELSADCFRDASEVTRSARRQAVA